ncbi:hypothetical protein CRG98_043554, partial [Punica granatum]
MAASPRWFCVSACFVAALLVLLASADAARDMDELVRSNVTTAEKTEDLQSSKNSSMADHSPVDDDEAWVKEHTFDDPEEVVSMVEMSIRNSTERRKLGFFSCTTGNPIDDCWRCDPKWHQRRKRLADCAIGFGRNAVGGRDGRYY